MCLSPISAVIAAQVFRAPIDVGEQPQKIKTPKAEMRLGLSFLFFFSSPTVGKTMLMILNGGMFLG